MTWLNEMEARRADLKPMNYDAMLTPWARRMVERIYAIDFEQYAADL